MATIFKPRDYNAIKNETNVGDCVSTQDVRNGYVGKIVYGYTDAKGKYFEKVFVPLAAGDLETDNIYIALFTPLARDMVKDKCTDGTFEMDYIKMKGDYVRVFQATRHQQLDFEFTANIVNTAYAAVAVGDTLIPATDGSMKWVVGTGATKAAMKVLQKDNLQGSMFFEHHEGSFLAKVVTNE